MRKINRLVGRGIVKGSLRLFFGPYSTLRRPQKAFVWIKRTLFPTSLTPHSKSNRPVTSLFSYIHGFFLLLLQKNRICCSGSDISFWQPSCSWQLRVSCSTSTTVAVCFVPRRCLSSLRPVMNRWQAVLFTPKRNPIARAAVTPARNFSNSTTRSGTLAWFSRRLKGR